MRAAFLIALLAAAAHAQEAGADAEGDDAGVVATLVPAAVWLPADATNREVPLDFPGRLAAGSEAGAGVDQSGAGEIIHPSNPAGLVAAVKTLGAGLFGGKTSIVVQASPYMVMYGKTRSYDVFVAERKASVVSRLLQDMSITTAIGPGSPYQPAASDDLTRWATIGLGASLEVLGKRSIYSDWYAKCLDDGANAVLEKVPVKPRAELRRKAGETDEQYDRRIAASPRVAAYLAEYAAQNAAISTLAQRCTQASLGTTNALFVSLGGRWVTTGTAALPDDRVSIQRAYLAIAWELYVKGLEVSLQARFLGDRPQPGAAMTQVGDLGLSLKWSSPLLQFMVQATQALIPSFDNAFATFTATAYVNVFGSFGLAVGVNGRGRHLGEAFNRLNVSLSLLYEDTPQLLKGLLPTAVPTP